MQSNTGSLNLPAEVPPLPTNVAGGGSITANSLVAISDSTAAQLPAFGQMYSYWKSTFGSPGFTAIGTLGSVEAGNFNPANGVVNVNPSLVVCNDPKITRGQVVETVAHEIRHAYQEAQLKQSGSVKLGVARDPATGAVTWTTMNRQQYDADCRKASAAAARRDLRTYAMSASEIDARIFAEWIRRDLK